MEQVFSSRTARAIPTIVCSVVALLGASLPASGEPFFLCNYDELMICGEGIGCSEDSKKNVDLPRQVKVDVSAGSLTGLDGAGNLREAKAQTIEERDGFYFLQAVQRTRREGGNVVGWTIFIDPKAMKISGSAVHANLVFSVFGSCKAQDE